ncbi:MAG TPA: YncE family protein [Fimbriiglobus sp.]|jgi:DNA-binding beta-propeller fold protein YncE
MRCFFTVVCLVVTAVPAIAVEPKSYKLIKSTPVPGAGSWDYLIVDTSARRVYVSHGTQVDVLDADSCEWKGKIADTPGVHGIALAPEFGRGFTSNGRSSTVTIFDLKTLKTLGSAETGQGPDSIIYDPATKRVFAFNGRGKSSTVIDAAGGKVVGTIDLGGQPEFAVSDEAGHVFVNLEDKNAVVKLDAKKMTVLETWPLAPGATPTGMAMDRKAHRLYVGCRSKHLVVVNVETGKVVATQPIGAGVDATAFDPETGLIYASCGDGTVSIFHADGSDKYSLVETLKTKPRSKTMALDPKTHRIFLPAMDYMPASGGGRPRPVPNSFAVMMFGN